MDTDVRWKWERRRKSGPTCRRFLSPYIFGYLSGTSPMNRTYGFRLSLTVILKADGTNILMVGKEKNVGRPAARSDSGHSSVSRGPQLNGTCEAG